MEKPNLLFSELLRKHAWMDGTIDRVSAIKAMEELQQAWEHYSESRYLDGKLEGMKLIEKIYETK